MTEKKEEQKMMMMMMMMMKIKPLTMDHEDDEVDDNGDDGI